METAVLIALVGAASAAFGALLTFLLQRYQTRVKAKAEVTSAQVTADAGVRSAELQAMSEFRSDLMGTVDTLKLEVKQLKAEKDAIHDENVQLRLLVERLSLRLDTLEQFIRDEVGIEPPGSDLSAEGSGG